MDPESTNYLSAPLHCDTGPCSIKPWDVKTYDSTYVGGVSVAKATLRSDNTVYARLTLDLGADKVAHMARKLGVRTRLDVNGAYVPSIGLGSIAVSPLDMASAYATLAAGGIRSKPMAITKVIFPNGKRDTSADWGRPRRVRVISQGVAYEVTQILQQNVLYGTGVGANFGRPAAGKTGTTDQHVDAWFCGYTPQLATCVWVGYPYKEVPMSYVEGVAGVTGGSLPAEIWHKFMSFATESMPVKYFPQPTFTGHAVGGQYYSTPSTHSYYTPSYTPPAAAPQPKPQAPPPPPPVIQTVPNDG
jgi:penicillin-binding protein 1A